MEIEARLIALETVIEALLTVASDYPHLREEIGRALSSNAAGATTTHGKRLLPAASRTLHERLDGYAEHLGWELNLPDA